MSAQALAVCMWGSLGGLRCGVPCWAAAPAALDRLAGLYDRTGSVVVPEALVVCGVLQFNSGCSQQAHWRAPGSGSVSLAWLGVFFA